MSEKKCGECLQCKLEKSQVIVVTEVQKITKLSELIGKRVTICTNVDEYYFEFEIGIKYKKSLWDIRWSNRVGQYGGVVVDVSTGRQTCIVVKSGGLLWDFADDEVEYEGATVMNVIKQWDFKSCKSLMTKEDKWGIDTK